MCVCIERTKGRGGGFVGANLENPPEPAPTLRAIMLESIRKTLGSFFAIYICRWRTKPPPISPSNKRHSCSPACSRFRLH